MSPGQVNKDHPWSVPTAARARTTTPADHQGALHAGGRTRRLDEHTQIAVVRVRQTRMVRPHPLIGM
jgi:hypothetical protein